MQRLIIHDCPQFNHTTRVLQNTYPVSTKHCMSVQRYCSLCMRDRREPLSCTACTCTHHEILLICVQVNAVIILWQHCRGPWDPQDCATLIERLTCRSGLDWQLTGYRQHLWQHINLKSKHYTGFCDELRPAGYKTDIFLVTLYTHIIYTYKYTYGLNQTLNPAAHIYAHRVIKLYNVYHLRHKTSRVFYSMQCDSTVDILIV